MFFIFSDFQNEWNDNGVTWSLVMTTQYNNVFGTWYYFGNDIQSKYKHLIFSIDYLIRHELNQNAIQYSFHSENHFHNNFCTQLLP